MIDLEIKRSPSNDLFPNLELIRCVAAPTLIIHGDNDEEVPPEHGKILGNNAKNLLDIWLAPNCGHNDIDIKQTKEFYKKLAWFYKEVEIGQKGKKQEEIYQKNKAFAWPEDFKHLYRKSFEEQAKNTQITMQNNKMQNCLG